MALLSVGVEAGMRVPVGFVEFAPDMRQAEEEDGAGFENRGQKKKMKSVYQCMFIIITFILKELELTQIPKERIG